MSSRVWGPAHLSLGRLSPQKEFGGTPQPIYHMLCLIIVLITYLKQNSVSEQI